MIHCPTDSLTVRILSFVSSFVPSFVLSLVVSFVSLYSFLRFFLRSVVLSFLRFSLMRQFLGLNIGAWNFQGSMTV